MWKVRGHLALFLNILFGDFQVLTDPQNIRHVLKRLLVDMPNPVDKPKGTNCIWKLKKAESKEQISSDPHWYPFLELSKYVRTELSPSVSMIMSTVSLSMSTGFPQIHKPLVQGIVVGPIANPVILLSRRLERKDFPVRCGPAMEATAIYILGVWYFFVLNAIKHLGSLLS
jgi:hypothetical protein